jgi:hypothetical protein
VVPDLPDDPEALDIFAKPFRPTLVNQLLSEGSLDARLRPKEKTTNSYGIGNKGCNC